MLRKDIVKSVQNVLSAITSAKILENVLVPLMKREKPLVWWIRLFRVENGSK